MLVPFARSISDPHFDFVVAGPTHAQILM
jgi:hypothetical protein